MVVYSIHPLVTFVEYPAWLCSVVTSEVQFSQAFVQLFVASKGLLVPVPSLCVQA